jgi:hypothetical protein
MAAKKSKGVADVESQRLNVRISPDAYRRLGVHAIMAGLTPGKLVESLITTHCREWKVQANRSAPVITGDRPEGVDSVSLATASAA